MFTLRATPTIHICRCSGVWRRTVLVAMCVTLMVLVCFNSLAFPLQRLTLTVWRIMVTYFDQGCLNLPASVTNAKGLVSPGTPLNFSPHFLIEEADFCQRRPHLSIVAYVHSSISSVEKRMETRSTWASAGAYDNDVRMGVVFMVGLAKTREEEKILKEESTRYHDIIQGNYTDTYHLLSYKALASLHWVTRHCLHVPWTLHTDDDVLIDVFFLTKFLESHGTADSFLCYIWDESPVRRRGRWCVQPEEFPEDNYPPYCAGGAWVMATPLGSRLLLAASQVPFLWVDDAYVTGVLAKYASVRHSKESRKFIRIKGIVEKDLGNVMAWLNLQEHRNTWWFKLLLHYNHLSPVTSP